MRARIDAFPYPHPALRATLSRRERDTPLHDGQAKTHDIRPTVSDRQIGSSQPRKSLEVPFAMWHKVMRTDTHDPSRISFAFVFFDVCRRSDAPDTARNLYRKLRWRTSGNQ